MWLKGTKSAWFMYEDKTVRTQKLEGFPQGEKKKMSIQDIHNKKNPRTKQVIKSHLTKCLRSLKINYFSVFREPTSDNRPIISAH